MVRIKDKEVQLGEIVRHAVDRTGLTSEAWNALRPLEREAQIAKSIYAMRGEEG
jgi:hypothetical protein